MTRLFPLSPEGHGGCQREDHGAWLGDGASYRGRGEDAALLLLPGEQVAAVDFAVAVGIAVARRGGHFAEIHFDNGQIAAVDDAVSVEVGSERTPDDVSH